MGQFDIGDAGEERHGQMAGIADPGGRHSQPARPLLGRRDEAGQINDSGAWMHHKHHRVIGAIQYRREITHRIEGQLRHQGRVHRMGAGSQ